MKTDQQLFYELLREIQKLIQLLNGVPRQEQEFFTTEEFAAYLRRPISYVYYLTSSRSIKFTRRGKRIYIYKHDADQWLSGGNINPLI